jgi:hypothetical protein
VAGSFGFEEVSRLALEGERLHREIDERATPPDAAELSRWREIVAAIRREFDPLDSSSEPMP